MRKNGEEGSPAKRKSVHLIGIGGIGMSSLSRWFLAQKWAVSGSDAEKSELTRSLKKEGVKLKIGHSRRHLGAPELVIYSNAVKPENPEFAEAEKRGIPLLSYPEMVGRLTRQYKTIAVAGAHGKSTTTAFVSLLLINAGFDPTVIIGTKLKEFSGSNFRKGKGDFLVLEADEFKKAFLHYAPYCTIVMNIDREHLDCYRDLNDIKRTFLRLMRQTQTGGLLVLNGGNPYLVDMRHAIETLARQNNIRVRWYSLRSPAAKKIAHVLKLPGMHNVENALAAYELGRALGIKKRRIFSSLSRYHGSWRRYEYRGKYIFGGITYLVFDDYAHHPTEIQATLRAFRGAFPRSAVVCIFQPHHAERLKKLFKDFTAAFDEIDGAILVPTYRVLGRDEKANVTTSEDLVEAMKKRHGHIPLLHVSDPRRISRKRIDAFVRSFPKAYARVVVVFMGAGDIVRHTDRILKG